MRSSSPPDLAKRPTTSHAGKANNCGRQAKKLAKQKKVFMSNAESKLQADSCVINAGEVAAFIAIVVAGFLFVKFLLMFRFKPLILSNVDIAEDYDLEFSKFVHTIDYYSVVLVLICLGLSVMVTSSKNEIYNRFTKINDAINIFIQKNRAATIFVFACVSIIMLSAPLYMHEQLNIYMLCAIMISILFIFVSAIAILWNLTVLAFFSAFYIIFCFSLTLMLLLLAALITTLGN